MFLDGLYRLAKPILFSLDAETSHSVALQTLRVCGPLMSNRVTSNEVTIAGITFKNKVGLAAGFDKDGIALRGLAKLGFGFLEVGTVTRVPQTGNPKPRMIRIPKSNAIINRMGFNNRGVEEVCTSIAGHKSRIQIPIGVNIGRSATTSNVNAIEDYEFCLDRAKNVADYITVNISSPNTVGLRDLSDLDYVEDFLNRLIQCRDALARNAKRLAIFVKISPDGEPSEIALLSKKIRDSGGDGIIATNTTIGRDHIDVSYSDEKGGLSGNPLFELACQTVEIVRNSVGTDFPIIGVGGIDSPTKATSMLNAGANLLQIYTSLIYQGPALVRQLGEVSGN